MPERGSRGEGAPQPEEKEQEKKLENKELIERGMFLINEAELLAKDRLKESPSSIDYQVSAYANIEISKAKIEADQDPSQMLKEAEENIDRMEKAVSFLHIPWKEEGVFLYLELAKVYNQAGQQSEDIINKAIRRHDSIVNERYFSFMNYTKIAETQLELGYDAENALSLALHAAKTEKRPKAFSQATWRNSFLELTTMLARAGRYEEAIKLDDELIERMRALDIKGAPFISVNDDDRFGPDWIPDDSAIERIVFEMSKNGLVEEAKSTAKKEKGDYWHLRAYLAIADGQAEIGADPSKVIEFVTSSLESSNVLHSNSDIDKRLKAKLYIKIAEIKVKAKLNPKATLDLAKKQSDSCFDWAQVAKVESHAGMFLEAEATVDQIKPSGIMTRKQGATYPYAAYLGIGESFMNYYSEKEKFNSYYEIAEDMIKVGRNPSTILSKAKSIIEGFGDETHDYFDISWNNEVAIKGMKEILTFRDLAKHKIARLEAQLGLFGQAEKTVSTIRGWYRNDYTRIAVIEAKFGLFDKFRDHIKKTGISSDKTIIKREVDAAKELFNKAKGE